MDVVELRLRSAEDLKDVRRVRVGKLLHPLFAAAWISASPAPLHRLSALPPHHSSALLHPSSAQAAGTLFPTWRPSPDSDIHVSVPDPRPLSNKFLVIRLYAQCPRSALPTRARHRLVGTVTVPLADIVSNVGWPSHNPWQLLSYNVKLPSGQHQGVLNFSARVSRGWVAPNPIGPPMTLPHVPYVC